MKDSLRDVVCPRPAEQAPVTQKDDSDIDDPFLEDNPTPVNGKKKRAAPLKNCPLLDQTS